MKKLFSYIATALFGAGAAFAINFYLSGIAKSSEDVSSERVVGGEENNPSEEATPSEENAVKLTDSQLQQMELTFAEAGPDSLSFTLSACGKITLVPDRLAHIVPKAPGVVLEAHKNVGNQVKANEILAVLESREMVDIKASYLAALSRKKLLETAYEREKRLYKEKISAEQDYLNAKNSYEESVINWQLARQKLQVYGLNEEDIDHLVGQQNPDLRTYEIISPMNGTVIMRHITPGEFIQDTMTIYEVADLSKVWVEINLYPKDLHLVKEGQKVELVAPDNRKIEATLIYVSPMVEDQTITAKAVAELDNEESLWKPGLFVKAKIITGEKSLPVVISKEALQSSEGQDFVFVPTQQGFERRNVKLGQSDGKKVEVLSGLDPKEKYVADKTFLLKAELFKGSAEDED